MTRILAVSGSLRAASSNTAALRAAGFVDVTRTVVMVGMIRSSS